MINTEIKPRVRKHLGYLEEYYAATGSRTSFGSFLGHRAVEETLQRIGTDNRIEFKIKHDTEIDRSFSKKSILRAGTKVCRIIFPLEGRLL